MARVRAGDLRHQVTLRRAATQRDAEGGIETLWSTVAVLGAKVEGLDGRESMMADALQGVWNYKITVRYRADVLPSDQLVLSTGTTVNIKSANDPDGQRRLLVILASTESVQDDAR